MHYLKHKIIPVAVFGIVLFLGFTYLAVFGRALSQRENHVGIALAIPNVILHSDAVRIDNETYLAFNTDSFIETMKSQRFIHTDQLGSGHVFLKDGKRYMASSRMYSAYFMVFTHPVEN